MARASRHMLPYPPEFRAEAIRLARSSGRSHRQIADDPGVTGETLRLWLKQADLDEGKQRRRLSGDQKSTLRRRRLACRPSTIVMAPSSREKPEQCVTSAVTHCYAIERY